jgi:predicted anti-sigma-YlaC factor YlaD
MSRSALVWKNEVIMLNCKQNTELLSQALDRPITFREKLAIRLHLMMCRGCRNFEKQLFFIRKSSRKMVDKL